MEKVKLKEITSKLQSGDGISSKEIKQLGIYPVYGGNGLRGYTDTYNEDGAFFFIGRQGAKCGNVHYHIGRAFMTEHAIVGKPSKDCNAVYLAYKLSLLDLGRLQGQSAQPGLAVGTLAEVELDIPSKNEQERIGELLHNIDKKIYLNYKLNSELEAMAKQLYDYWFVQFDFPDENGRPYKSSGGKMVYNSTLKREIPEGWEVKNLNQMAESYRGVSYNKDDLVPLSERSILVLRGNNIPCSGQFAYDSNVAYIPKSLILDEQRINKGDIIITMSSGSKEHIGKCFMFQRDSNHTFGAFLSKFVPHKECRFFVYLCMLSDFFKAFVKTTCNGTGINNLTNDTFNNIYFPVPEATILNEFEIITGSIYSQVGLYQKQAVDLVNLRDSLLPMLMNGQVSIS